MWVPEGQAPGRRERIEELSASGRRLGRLFLRAAGGLVDVVLPPSCPVCRVLTGQPHALCTTCWGKVRFMEEPWCERLGTPLPYDLGPGALSAEAVAHPPLFHRARAAAIYDDTTAGLVHAFKYGDRLDLAPLLAAWMRRAGRDLLAEADVLVPVPLHRVRLLRRRFNQAAVLCRALSRDTGLPHDPGLLVRHRQTRQQVGLSREARMENVRGAFRVPPRAKARLMGRKILLVDDVATTGSTLEAATRALLSGGAERVDVLTFARVVGSAA